MSRAERLAGVVAEYERRLGNYREAEGPIEPKGRFVLVEHCAGGDYCWLRFSDAVDFDLEDDWTPYEVHDLDTGARFAPRLVWERC